MKKRILSSVLLALALTSMLAGCGNQNKTKPDNNMTDQTTQNDAVQNNGTTDLPNAPDNGSNVQGDKNMVGDSQKPNDGSVTKDAKDMADNAGDMVGDAGRMVGDAANDAGRAVKNATDSTTGKK
ncbi:hypothetical protein [Butyricicoccus pullicaecorum]|uniref:hypothetical protein n=1 Tax=Butyricicoccus pullicaecorum TaxID=501571 RepID=UPI003522D47E